MDQVPIPPRSGYCSNHCRSVSTGNPSYRSRGSPRWYRRREWHCSDRHYGILLHSCLHRDFDRRDGPHPLPGIQGFAKGRQERLFVVLLSLCVLLRIGYCYRERPDRLIRHSISGLHDKSGSQHRRSPCMALCCLLCGQHRQRDSGVLESYQSRFGR